MAKKPQPAGMIRFLRNNVHLLSVGDDLVGLNVSEGAYVCAPGLGGAVGPRDARARVEIAVPEAAEALEAARLVSDHPPHSVSPWRPPPPAPTSSVWRSSSPPITSFDRRRMARAYAAVLRHYYGRPFRSLIATAARGAWEAPTREVTADLGREAQVFDQLLPFVPFQGECLFRSFMLLMFLRLGGHDARWVLGVQTYPFQAHCWLQVGDTALDDAAERICGFTPIFAV